MASYYVWSAAVGSANGTSWANAYTTLNTAITGKTLGDVFYLAHDHAETSGGSVTITPPGAGTFTNMFKVICVNRAGSVPPVSADRRTTGQISITGTTFLTLNGGVHYDGIIFNAGTGTGASAISITGSIRFDNCSLRIGATGAGNINITNNGANVTNAELNNTTISFSGVGQTIIFAGALRWRNTPSALIGTAVPTTLFTYTSLRGGFVECIGVDFSAAGSGKTICGTSTSPLMVQFKFVDCKFDAAATWSAAPTDPCSMEEDFIRCGASGNYAVRRHRLMGLLTEETTIVRTGGASDGTTPISWKVVTTANCVYSRPFECPPIAIWNDTTGSAKTATIECISAAVANDDEVWVDLEYLGDASSPQGAFVNDGKADLLATAAAQTGSSAAWGGSTAPFKLAVTFTAQKKGWVYARVKCAKASSTFYIDPLVTLT